MESNFTSDMQTLLMKAWRDRWPPKQWAAYVKHSIKQQRAPPDYLEFGDLLLSQALVGTVPNSLILSYLKQAVSTQVISIPTMVKIILTRVEDEKLYWIRQVLEILQDIIQDMSIQVACRDGPGVLCNSLYQIAKWCLRLIDACLIRVQEQKLPMEQQTIIEQACRLVKILLSSDPHKALVQVTLLDETSQALEEYHSSICNRLMSTQLFPDIRTALDDTMMLVPSLLYQQVESDNNSFLVESCKYIQSSTLSSSLIVQACVVTDVDTPKVTQQILTMKELMKMSNIEMYFDILHSCISGLVETADREPHELLWTAFTYLKLPQVMMSLQQHIANSGRELELALEKLITYTPLLDLADKKTQCDCIQFLIGEFVNHGLLQESQKGRLLQLRLLSSHYKVDGSNQNQKSIALILRAEPTVSSILKTLEADYTKNQEGLLGVLHHMMSGKSFELILAAGAASGKLNAFIHKIIKFNELAKNSTGESGKCSQIRAMLFDISFLMLCYIIQKYKLEVITSIPYIQQSFFVCWAKKYFPTETSVIRHLEDDSSQFETHKIDGLIQQLMTSKELKFSLTKWNEVCINLPYAIREMIFAWEAGVMSFESIQAILNGVKSQMCCLSVCLTTWLSSYSAVVGESIHEKCLLIVKYLQVTPSESTTQYFFERCNLLTTILNTLPVHISDISNDGNQSKCHDTAYKQLQDVLSKCLSNGYMTVEASHKYSKLIKITGVEWMVSILTQELYQKTRLEDISRSLHVVHALFMIDIQKFTVTLLNQVLPKWLKHGSCEKIANSALRSFTILTVLCIASTQASTKGSKGEDDLLTSDDPLYRPLLRLFEIFTQVCKGSHGNNQSVDFVHLFLGEMISVGKGLSKYFQVFLENEKTKELLRYIPQELTMRLFRSHKYVFKALGNVITADIVCSCVSR